jgi:tryptophan-rich sensory protein
MSSRNKSRNFDVVSNGEIEVYETKSSETTVTADVVNVVIESQTPTTEVAKTPVVNGGYVDFNNGLFWLFLILAIVSAVVLMWIGGTADARSMWNSYVKVGWGNNLGTLAIFQFIAVILLFWASYLAYRNLANRGDLVGRNGMAAIIVLQVLGWVIAFVLIFRQRQTLAAGLFSIVLLVLVAIQFYFTWRSGSVAGLWILAVYTLWLILVTFLGWNIYTNNHNP